MRSHLAETIARDLFLDSSTKRQADRLVHVDRGEMKGYTGWGESALADRIDLALEPIRKEVANALLWLREERGGYRTLAIEQLTMTEDALKTTRE